jgi:hypothetical protein
LGEVGMDDLAVEMFVGEEGVCPFRDMGLS